MSETQHKPRVKLRRGGGTPGGFQAPVMDFHDLCKDRDSTRNSVFNDLGANARVQAAFRRHTSRTMIA